MTIFEVKEGQVAAGGDDSNRESLQGEVRELESFANAIGLSLGGRKLDRAVATFESKGFGIRYSTSDNETISGRGIEMKGRKNPSSFVDKLY
jgi:hypothetical protein